MARGRAVGEAGARHEAGEVAQPQHLRIERLVDVEVDRAARRGCHLQAGFEAAEAVVVEVRAPAGDVDAQVERVAEQRAMVRARQPRSRKRCERDDLDVDEVAELLAYLDERLHAAQPDDAAEVAV